MWDSKTVSIIVPVYQKGNYIDKAVTSLLQQTYPQIEILLIDDGSSDESLSKCREWEKRESNIQVYHHSNKGVSYTRNVGILHASGDYIMFMDADDTLVENAVEKMVYELEKNHSDVCICGYTREKRKKTTNYIPSISGVFTKSQFIEQNFEELYQKNILHNIGTKMYRKDILQEKGIYFREGYTVCEDIIFCLDFIKATQNVSIIGGALYTYYCDDFSSVNHNYRGDLWDNVFELNKSVADIIGETDLFYTIIVKNIYGAFLNELLVKQFKKYMIREKLSSVCSCEDIIKSKGKARLSELTWEQRIFIISLWYKQCWLIYLMLRMKHKKAEGKRI